MKNQLEVITTSDVLGKTVNVYGTAEDPLFLAKDVAEWIDYAKTSRGSYDVSNMLKTVDLDEKVVRTLFVSGQNRDMTMLTENGLYEVLMQSRKPIAKQFKSEVKKMLKSVRKHGMYATDDTIDKMINSPEFGIKLLTALQEERKAKAEIESKLQEQQSKNKELITDIKVKNLELQESNETIDTLMCVSQTYKANDLAKELGFKSANAFNEKLREMKIQYKQGGDWYFYSQYSGKGYDSLKQYILPSGAVHYNRRFTQAGRAFILSLFKDAKNK